MNYTVPAEEANQVDLMYAVATNQTKPTDKNSVTMPFKHALTQVHFAIGTSATNLFVDVEENGIQIHNLKNTGTFASSTETWTLNAGLHQPNTRLHPLPLMKQVMK
ncbi:MAG: fimbrillin family protein [Butyricimonas faecihominis]